MLTEGQLISWAASYDVLVQVVMLGRAGSLRRHIVDLMQLSPTDVVLDAGCGTGDLALRIARRIPAGSVTGIDASQEMIARAQRKAHRHHAPIDFRVEPVETLSFPDGTFDKVASTLVLHHLPGDLKQQALASLARVLKPGGRLFIVDFLSTSGQLIGHSSDAHGPMLPDLLRAAGLSNIQFTGLGFRSIGALFGFPPMNLMTATRG